MAFKIGERNNRSNSGGERRGSSETIAVRVESVHAAGKTVNYAEDYFVGTLLHNAMGIDVDATRDQTTWASTTQLKFRLRDPNYKGADSNRPYNVGDLYEGASMGNAKPMGKNPVVMLESAYIDAQTGDVSARWMHIGAIDAPLSPLDVEGISKSVGYLHPNLWTQVGEEYEGKDADGNPKMKQRRTSYLTDYAQIVAASDGVSIIDDLAAKAAEWLTPNPNIGGGQPCVVVRIESTVSGNSEAAFLYPARDANGHSIPGIDADNSIAGAVQAVQAFLDAQHENDKSPEKDSNFAFFLQNIEAEPEYIVEMIPVWQFNTGAKSTPTARAAAATNGRVPKHDHEDFQFTVFDKDGKVVRRRVVDADKKPVKDQDGKNVLEDVTQQLIGRAHMQINRKFEARDNAMRPWTASKTRLVKPFDSVFHHISDLPTAATPVELVAIFEQKAALRQKLNADYKAGISAPAAAEPPAEEGVPDDSNNLQSSFTPG
jgi:hypothetical protein